MVCGLSTELVDRKAGNFIWNAEIYKQENIYYLLKSIGLKPKPIQLIHRDQS